MKFNIVLRMLIATHLTTQSFIRSAKLSSLRRVTRVPTELKRVVVVGGGAAGYFSAIECAKLLSESQEKNGENIQYEVKKYIHEH
jgi:NADH dehydrogenase FAD-containing subunit